VPSDAELVAACKDGKVEAYEQLYRAHGARMKSIAYHFLRNTSDAEDAVQEAFLKVYRSMNRFKGSAAFSTWFYRVLLNTCYDMMRRRRRRPSEPTEDETGETTVDTIRAEAEDHPLRLTLEKCLLKLPFRNRTVFLLFEVEGFRHREIAELLGIPEGTSKTLLFEARRELQRSLWQNSGAGRI
jgi:RNA polymerase sigma-70 factor (ECF subfamily)